MEQASAGSGTQPGRANGLIVAMGLLLIVLALANWFIPDSPRANTVTTRATGTTTTETTDPSREVSRKSRRVTTTTTKGGSVTTVVAPAITSVVTRPGTPTRRSESFTLALLGVGVAISLVGAFYGRIQSIKLPGGAGVDLSAVTTPNEELSKRVTQLESSVQNLAKALRLVSGLPAGERDG